jgi:hypothetical protein
MLANRIVTGLTVIGFIAGAAHNSLAQDAIKIGLILPMTGPQQSTGRQVEAAARLYMQQHGNIVAGEKIEIVLRDDSSVPDNTKRLAQDLIVNETPRAVCRRAARDPGQGPDYHHGRWPFRRHGPLALLRANQLHGCPIRRYRRLGRSQRHQERGHDRGGLYARNRQRIAFQGGFH